MDVTTLGAALAITGKRIAAVEEGLESINVAYTYKGSVASISALPASGNTTGDMYTVDGSQYVWDGTEWIVMSIKQAQIDALFTA